MCTSVIPCLPSGLATSNNIMSMFVLFSWLFGYFESLVFSKMVGQTLHQNSQTGFFSRFSEGTTQGAKSLSIEINHVYLIYVLHFTSAFKRAMDKIFTNTCLCSLSCFNFTSLTLYFWLHITPLLTRHHIFLLSLMQSSSSRVLKMQN